MATITPTTIELWPGAGESRAWTLESEFVRATIAAHGAHVCNVQMLSGSDWIPISVDYPHVPEPGPYHGPTIGRWANRIAGSSYSFDGTTHTLEANEGAHQLHGGPDGFDQRTWNPAWCGADRGLAEVNLELLSPDGDQGFPGEVRASARFMLWENRLTIEYEAEATEPTPLNLTHHVYWNLGGAGPLDDHDLYLASRHVVTVDAERIPLAGPPVEVEDTRFDCTTGRSLAEIVTSGGFDHSFVLSPAEPQVLLTHHSGRQLSMTTDQVGVQIYTGDHLDPSRRGLAIEPQRLPDGPNRSDFGPAVGTEFSSASVIFFDHT